MTELPTTAHCPLTLLRAQLFDVIRSSDNELPQTLLVAVLKCFKALAHELVLVKVGCGFGTAAPSHVLTPKRLYVQTHEQPLRVSMGRSHVDMLKTVTVIVGPDFGQTTMSYWQ